MSFSGFEEQSAWSSPPNPADDISQALRKEQILKSVCAKELLNLSWAHNPSREIAAAQDDLRGLCCSILPHLYFL
jgi:hypothetical protein